MYGWRRDDDSDGHSLAAVQPTSTGWTVHGVEVLVGDDTLACWFQVDLDHSWMTAAADVRVISDLGETTLALTASVDREWTANGRVRPDLRGCLDVDVAATPLTNTFPIRRFTSLAVGETRVTPIAWVEVPSLQVSRVIQTYRRLAPCRWEYSDPTHGAFVLEVDADGVVESYQGFAIRIPT